MSIKWIPFFEKSHAKEAGNLLVHPMRIILYNCIYVHPVSHKGYEVGEPRTGANLVKLGL